MQQARQGAVESAGTGLRRYRMYIGGRWVDARSGATYEVRSPATGEPVAAVPQGDEADVDAALAAAREAFDDGRWSGRPPAFRAQVLYRMADLMEARARQLAELETAQTGKPIALSAGLDLPLCVDNTRFFAGIARHLGGLAAGEYLEGYHSLVRRDPVGVVAAIAPWNYPLMMAVWKVMPALAAGNCVVIKPASLTPLTTLELAAIAEEAGLPPGVLNVVTGPGGAVGRALVRDPRVDMVSLTGDTATGRQVMADAAPGVKRLHLELGGKAPFIVFADADLEAAVRGAVHGAFANSGQDCTAATRIYVQKPVFDRFVADLADAARRVRLGLPLDERTEMGPVISAAQRERVEGFVERARAAGAEVVAGGRRPDDPELARGYYYEPTVLTGVGQDAEIVRQEVFGPVVAVLPFADEAEAVRLANDTIYGLAASVWTQSVQRAQRMVAAIRAGTVWVNDHLVFLSEMPHGGFKQSGFGKDLGVFALEEYTVVKHVTFDVSGEPVRPWHFMAREWRPRQG